jgi:ATP-dependent DNA ligase
MMARRDPVGIWLLTRRGNDWANRYPLVVEAMNHLKVRSCLIVTGTRSHVGRNQLARA